MQYTNQEKVEQFLGRSLTDGESNLLSTLVESIEIQIDNELGTTFKNDSSLIGITRSFDGGNRHLDIGGVQNVTNISLVSPDGLINDTVTSDLYVLRPSTGVVRSIDLRYGHLPHGYSNITVTGDFTEYDASKGGVPADIQIVATRATGALINNSGDTQFIKMEKVEGHEVIYQDLGTDVFNDDPIIKRILDSRRMPFLDDSTNYSSDSSYDEDDYFFR